MILYYKFYLVPPNAGILKGHIFSFLRGCGGVGKFSLKLNVKDDDEIGGLFLLQLEKVGMMMNTLLYCYIEDYTTLVW